MARKHKNYQVDEVVKLLNRKRGCKVFQSTKFVEVMATQDDLGNGSWGKIDFLTNHCGYTLIKVKSFSRN